MNRTLLNMLRTLPERYKSNWKDHASKLVHAYNSTEYESIGYSPFFLLFGRSPRLPIDLVFDFPTKKEFTSYPAYVSKWKRAMQEAYMLTSKSAQREAVKGKTQRQKGSVDSLVCRGSRSRTELNAAWRSREVNRILGGGH